MQIKEAITGIGTSRDEKLWGYFKTFQENMRKRERILKNIVENYSTNIYFMVKKLMKLLWKQLNRGKSRLLSLDMR